MRVRDRAAVASGGVVVLAGVVTTPRLATIPTAAAVAVVVWLAVGWPTTRRRAAWPTAAAAVVSLGATSISFVGQPAEGSAGGTLGLVESAALLLVTAVIVRWSPRREAVTAGLLAASAVAVWILRFLPDPTPLTVVGAAALWSIAPLGAAVIGGYPRLAERRRRQSVASARRDQRLELARDLHDFVAHDISGMIVQAQAGQFVAATNPGQALDALKRIEVSGLRALASMDRTVQMLHDDRTGAGDADRTPLPGLADLPELAERFTTAGAAYVHLDRQAGINAPRETGTTVYRIVVEALTNVRRHAPSATVVQVTVGATGPTLTVTISDNAAATPTPPAPRTERRGGSGLASLAARVDALGGTLTSGPEPTGWRVVAALPVPPQIHAG
ncbi:two-component sensor histidine kinase [Solihabitans fulvus]|uniref:histidine kinase n=1 Tax=Solihabitans fulvus TaxID=1892852 RepID=A0A5B2X8M9_9PSEU|nr:histidine kinase [Solihabitans fulvus]KAA2259399.1 two-component sensor histidine kinase [Solihabitans fulvus]